MNGLLLKGINTFSITFTKLKSVWLMIIIIPLLILVFDAEKFNIIILFAVTLVAYLKASGAESMVSKAFKGKEVRTIFVDTL